MLKFIKSKLLPGGRPAKRQDAENRNILTAMAEFFDGDYYAAQDSSLSGSADSLLQHYQNEGWRRGLDPCARFSTHAYLEAYPDVADADINPLVHFVNSGRAEGRLCISVAEALEAEAPPQAPKLADYECEAAKKYFQPEYYLAQLDGEDLCGLSPLQHYIAYGVERGLDPCPEFSTVYYLSRNPDVAAAPVHPFLHYCLAGAAEGRAGRHPLGARARVLEGLLSPAQRSKLWMRSDEIEVGDAEVLAERLAPAVEGGRELVVALSHDNYTQNIGGLQLCVGVEEAAFIEAGAGYLQVSPAQPLPALASAPDPSRLIVTLVLDGETIGHFFAGDLAAWLSAQSSGVVRAVVVHALLGFDLDTVSALCEAAARTRRFFWLHDFVSICPGYNLLRNDLVFCGAPDKASAACDICIYGEERRAGADRMAEFFRRHMFTVIAPSQSTADLWLARAGLDHAELLVHPHCTLTPRANLYSPGLMAANDQPADRPVRIAFLGFPTPAKGWCTLEDLLASWRFDPRYEFHHFGSRDSGLAGVKFHEVKANGRQRGAMIDAIRRERIDQALILSLCPETYCFTAHETLAAGADIVAFASSGNVATLVNTTGRGVVVEDATALNELFSGDRLVERARETRSAGRQISEMTPSRMTADLVDITARASLAAFAGE